MKRIQYESEFDKAVQEYYQEIFRYCQVKLRYCKEDAEECCQKVFEALYSSQDKLKDFSNIRAWLYRTADNFIKKEWNNRKKAKLRLVSLPSEDGGELPSALTVEMNYDDAMDDEEIEFYKDSLMYSWSESDRKMYKLRFEQKLPYFQIAELLQISEDAARQRVHHMKKQAMKKIRKLFE